MASIISAGTTSGTALNMAGDTSGQLQLATNGSTTALTIDTSQNVGIGTASPTNFGSNFKMLAVQGTDYGVIQGISNSSSTTIEMMAAGSIGYLGTRTNHPLALRTNDTERMRIDSSGNVMVGKTTTALTTTGVLIGGPVDIGYMSLSRSQTTNADITLQVYSAGASANRFYVGMGGTVYATSTTITGISDQRVKENIVDLDDGLDAVMALKPRKFDWKEGKGKDIKGDRGFIAQEFETVFPDMIDEWRDPAPEGEEPYKAVRADLIPVLVKAIQEQQTLIVSQSELINDLKARVTALEAK